MGNNFNHNPKIFERFSQDQFADLDVLKFAEGRRMGIDDVADGIVASSEQGRRPVNLHLANPDEFSQFALQYGRIVQIDTALMSRGWKVSVANNPERNGRYYFLEKAA